MARHIVFFGERFRGLRLTVLPHVANIHFITVKFPYDGVGALVVGEGTSS